MDLENYPALIPLVQNNDLIHACYVSGNQRGMADADILESMVHHLAVQNEILRSDLERRALNAAPLVIIMEEEDGK